jgi:hypothetical protein
MEMKKFGFRPDGIAYLLILIGEVFCSGLFKIEGKITLTSTDLKMRAIDIF